MSRPVRKIDLPADFEAFAEERVRSGKAASVEEVVREALAEKKLTALREALDVGIAQFDAGKVAKGTPGEIINRVLARHGLPKL